MAAPPTHSRILEINLISAEDIALVSKNMKTYAVAWVQPDRKLATGVDQTGGTDPSWNERFMFRVDDKFLNSEDATIVVEIYAAAWVKDALIGYVNVLIKDIFHLRSVTDAKINNSTTRTVTLQIRRPSGRPQGILNMEVALVDSTMRSMPLLEDPKPITSGQNKENHENNEPQNYKLNANAKISRSQSDRTDLTMEDNWGKRPDKGSIVNGGSGSNGSAVKGNGSMVNGDSLCNSDLGPSASVVAEAIAKGLYKPPINRQAQSKETSKSIREWTKKEREEDLERKLERWRSDIPPSARKGKSSKERRSRGKRSEGTKLFSCFGNAFGLEISITCGGGKKKHGKGRNKICHLSSVDDNYNQSVV
ncbi:uncharacterized protein LOC111294632 [Durio zibethinus]|uniref:Uncharacterized protein LOC111294632 n=1 Tax=Durio zibethinus TaxID=66656 RepID=A0A6P5YUJ4_DURZI|nr:uncharacterized protein LOC111294632 [Durio zibethinus]